MVVIEAYAVRDLHLLGLALAVRVKVDANGDTTGYRYEHASVDRNCSPDLDRALYLECADNLQLAEHFDLVSSLDVNNFGDKTKDYVTYVQTALPVTFTLPNDFTLLLTSSVR
jgi:hypothetical protein